MWYLPASDRIWPLRKITVDGSRSTKPFRWSHFPLVVLVAQLLCRELTQENEYLRTQHRILRSKLRRREKQEWDDSDRRIRKPRLPRTPRHIEELVCGMVRAVQWGYKRICGELKRLGIRISRACVADILRRNGLPPSPE